MNIIHEDERIVAIHKPAGELVIPGRNDQRPSLAERLKEKFGKKPYIIHRIDRETSGLVLFAKDAEAHKRLSIQFEKRKVRKTYLALAGGILPESGIIDKPIKRFGSGRMGVDNHGKPSTTHYRLHPHLKGWQKTRFNDASLVEVEPKTGRQHQIRVHFYAIGHPIAGDPLYGKPIEAARLMLHSWTLKFTHPDGDPMRLQADPGNDFVEILRPMIA